MIPRRPGRPLGVGVQLPEVEREVRWPELRAIARTAEQAGFDSVWVGDHLLYRYRDGSTRAPWEVWTTLAGLAEATERVAIGPLVASTAFHQPFILAKLASTVDEISGGRLVLGLGAGWNDVEFAALGAPFDHRISRFEEAFTIVRTLLADGAIDFAGEFYTARDAEILPKPSRPGGPPLMVGSIGPRMLAATLPHVAAWNAWYADTKNSPAGVPRLRTLVDEACAAVDATRARWSGRSRSRSGCPAGRARSWATPTRRWPWRRSPEAQTRLPRACAPTLPRGSATSSWSWTPSPRRRWRHLRPC
ncbi:MAG: LLM class flavin-dependent oxidoreductase [Chloroflexota bacterium]